MVFIVGHTRKEYFVEGILLPKKEYNEIELAHGRKTVVPLDDAEWEKIKGIDFVKELLASGSISALDSIPVDKYSAGDLQEALRKSEEQRLSLQEQLLALRKEAVETITSLQAEIRKLKGEE